MKGSLGNVFLCGRRIVCRGNVDDTEDDKFFAYEFYFAISIKIGNYPHF